MNIDKYNIVVQDEYNLRLSVEVPKGKNPKTGEITKDEVSDKFIGYFGSLTGALKKIANMEIKEFSHTNTLESVLEALEALETKLDLKYGDVKVIKTGDKL